MGRESHEGQNLEQTESGVKGSWERGPLLYNVQKFSRKDIFLFILLRIISKNKGVKTWRMQCYESYPKEDKD